MGLVDAKNKVPELQKFYQAAYKDHQRLWKINPRSRIYMVPFNIALYGTLAATLYAGGRKVAGYNSYFGKN
ncbi:hypothetical protein Cob_v005660 [Colletotrichum orbiculare MAFF 240422]|uniref:Uncharacterized protein n=1 Tax=Colletotrichum orbiculare (strain 104-T / ATCC 96160 / CBS 514.97 / LARS 414 / MAFF 240422) TaxID=1213857 RepID=N4ULH3_COLOR|nr:hypothetical protein Cob_v005660 [Colletotrichum orbiculare MAFF 240422]